MITIKRSEILLKQDHEQVAKALYSKTAKKSFIQFTQTSTWVIFPERPMIGCRTREGAIICRYRHVFESFFPKIYAHWKVVPQEGQTRLVIVHKLGYISFFIGSLLMLSFCADLFAYAVDFNLEGLLTKSLPVGMLLTIGALLVKREVRETESLLMEIALERQGANAK